MSTGNTLPKTERIHHKKLIDSLFGGGKSRSMTAFPLRLVYMPMEESDDNQMLVSVPKRCLHRANKRNRVKRQVREAYRLNKGLISSKPLALAFIWLDSKLWSSNEVTQCMVSLLKRVEEKLHEND